MNQAATMIPCPIGTAVATRPHAIVAVEDGRLFTYKEFDARITRIGAGLVSRDWGPANCLASQLPNSVDSWALMWACFRNGLTVCPISTRIPMPQAAEIARDLGATFLSADDLDCLLHGAHGESKRSTEPPRLDVERHATIVLTSGSSGKPKAVVHSLAAHFASAKASNANIRLRSTDRWMLNLPLFHVGGLAILFRCVLAQAVVVIDRRSADLIQLLRANEVTHLSMVSTQLKRMLDGADSDIASGTGQLKAVLLGGSAFPDELILRAIEYGLPIHTTYGMSEMASQVTTTPPACPADKRLTSGRLIGENEIRVSSSGEILLRGPSRMKGYLHNGSLVEPWDADGWFKTGDKGWVDEDGYLWVHGRMDNMFISGGENIHPETIESAILDLCGVRQVIVVPVRDPEFGEVPVAFVDSEQTETAKWIAALSEKLARFMVPRTYYPWPQSESRHMKPNRSEFAKLAHAMGQSGGAKQT